MQQDLEAEKAWRRREGIGEDEVRIAGEGLPEGRVRVERRSAERRGEGAGRALGRPEVAVERRRAAAEEIEVRKEGGGREEEGGDGRRRKKTPETRRRGRHLKIASFRQPHFCSL